LHDYLVAIDLCVLCVWSGWFHSFARKSTRIWRCWFFISVWRGAKNWRNVDIDRKTKL